METNIQPIEKGKKGTTRQSFTVTGDETWHGTKLETPQSTNLLVDDGTGEERIIRRFEFALPPQKQGDILPTNKQLLDFHRQRILAFVWKDGMEAISELGIVRKKNKFFIEVLCMPERSATGKGSKHKIYQKPLTLKQVIHGN